MSGFYGDESHSNLLICDMSLVVRTQAGGSSEVLVEIYQTTRYRILEEVILKPELLSAHYTL
jgi:hypothetical protein